MPEINKEVINKAIPDNIDKFVSYLVENGIKYDEFINAGQTKKKNLIYNFIKKYPEILQLKLF